MGYSLTTHNVPALTDSDLAQEIKRLCTQFNHILVVANKFTVGLYCCEVFEGPWTVVCVGELGTASVSAINQRNKKTKVWWSSTDTHPANADLSKLTIIEAKSALVKNWIKESDKISGREGHVSPETKKQVAYLAAFRCQFPGCGKDLGVHATTAQKGTFSYFAHIVAASEDGPRGCKIESKLLVDEPSNFLLLCDECHRLIDKVDPKKYQTPVLREIRNHSIAEVSRLLDYLKYPPVEAWAVLGNVSGQMPHISNTEANEALWQAGLRQSQAEIEYYLKNGGQHHQPHAASYWSAAFRTLEVEVQQIQAKLSGMRGSDSGRPRLAIFPFHGTSFLLLAGRILGDMPGTHLFQPHRNTIGAIKDTRWAWPEDAVPPQADKFKIRTLRDYTNNAKEATLLVSLTFNIKPERLADASVTGNQFSLPTLEIYLDSPSHEVIRHPTDLMLFSAVIDDAFRTLQDKWGVEKVHLYVGAPTTAVMTIGQKMQARNQASYICYESLPGGIGSKFQATIQISSNEVRELISNGTLSLQK